MKAAKWYGRRDIRIENITEPTPGPLQVKIKVKWCGICGTDLHEYSSGPIFIPVESPHPLTGQQAPVVMGHELSGDVIEVGDQVSKVKIGDRVCIEPMYPCNECRACKAGQYNYCSNLAFHGIAAPGGGGFAEVTVVDERMVYPLSPNMSYEQGALVEPTAMVLHAVRQSGLRLGDTVAVFGAGPIGLLIIEVAKAAGAKEIISVEISEERRAFARATGATHTVNPIDTDSVQAIHALTNGGVDVTFEATGAPSALNAAIDSTIFDGQIVIVSIWEKEASIFPNSLVMQGRKVKGIQGNCNTFPSTIRLISEGKINVDQFVTKRIKLEELVDEGFEALVHEKRHVKILVDPTSD